MSKKKKKAFGTDVVVLILILILFGLVFQVRKEERVMKKGKRYTVGMTTNIYKDFSSRSIRFEYVVGGEIYSGTMKFDQNLIVPHGRYLVEFSIFEPKIHKEFTNCWVPHGIIAPDSGWSSIPNEVVCK